MPRTIGDISDGDIQWPNDGWCVARCISAVPSRSKKKKTPGVQIIWRTVRDESFPDTLFVTGKALGRLALVAKRLCEWPDDRELPDDDLEAARVLARFICDTLPGQDAEVEIASHEETFMYESGPKVGQKGTAVRHRVSYSGYRPVQEGGADDDGCPVDEKPPLRDEPEPGDEGDNLPF